MQTGSPLTPFPNASSALSWGLAPIRLIKVFPAFEIAFFPHKRLGGALFYFFPSSGLACFIFARSESYESHFDLQPVPLETGDPNERAGCKGN